MTTSKKNRWLRRLFYSFAAILILSVLLRLFVFEVYKVTKNSMNNTYQNGDRVVVNKLAKKNVSRNDIVVFNYKNDVFIKRCIGLPGETVEIKEGIFYIDKKEIPFPKHAILPSPYSNDTVGSKNNKDINIVMFDLLGKNWSIDNFGPYIIPKKGMTIQLTNENAKLYKKLLEGESSIPKQSETSFTFKNDYFFVVGDNRPKSEDSRIFGAIDKTKIIGTVSFSF